MDSINDPRLTKDAQVYKLAFRLAITLLEKHDERTVEQIENDLFWQASKLVDAAHNEVA